MKEYHWRGSTYQFSDDKVPADAVEVKQAEPKNKSRTPSSKAVSDDKHASGGADGSSRKATSRR